VASREFLLSTEISAETRNSQLATRNSRLNCHCEPETPTAIIPSPFLSPQSKDAMATAFRAIVMLVVLVGLPAAWVYYGPLPPSAMGVIHRTVATAKQSLGWKDQSSPTRWTVETPKTAPRFDASVVQTTRSAAQTTQLMAQATHHLQQQTASQGPVVPTQPMTRDSQFTLATATVPAAKPVTPMQAPMKINAELARQLEPHLSLLRSLDATEYTLENWGGEGKLYRFRCAITLGESDDHTRQFEAVHADPLRAVHQVVGEVTSWQNARLTGGATRWR